MIVLNHKIINFNTLQLAIIEAHLKKESWKIMDNVKELENFLMSIMVMFKNMMFKKKISINNFENSLLILALMKINILMTPTKFLMKNINIHLK